MKRQFDLYVYLSDIEHLLNLNKALEIIDKPAADVLEAMDDSLVMNQYSLTTLKDFLYKNHGINYLDHVIGIYFGQETCENLIPTLKHTQHAVEFCKSNEYTFTLTTPYVGPKGMDRLRKLFEYLNSEEKGTEIVVNDFGVLHLLNKEYTNLKPILGRLLIKMKRDPRFSLSGYEIANVEIKNIKKVEENQQEALQGASLELALYQNFLKSKNIERVSLDTLTQGMNQKALKKWSFPVDLYWPWTYVTSSRSCAIAAHTQPRKEFHPTEEPCHFQCKKYEFTFTSDKKMLPSLFRGNAVWMSTRQLLKEYAELGIDRLIYEPYIPV
jgi:hypothetical protein